MLKFLATPPQTEAELRVSASKIRGSSLRELAQAAGLIVPENLLRMKGWIGQLLELHLGATAGNQAEPDFKAIGVELKTVPVDARGKPRETTYVCTAPLMNVGHHTWATSTVRKKLARVLWVPIEADPHIPLAERRVLDALLWSPSAQQEASLCQDWEELMELICLGQLETITANHGRYLQIRPKAANARALTWGIDAQGNKVQTLPRGFYLRTQFTQKVLADLLEGN